MSQLLQSTLDRVNQIRRRSLWLTLSLRLFRAFCLAGTMFVLWMAVQPGEDLAALGLSGLTFCLALTFQVKSEFHKIKQSDFLISLDMGHEDASSSPYKLSDPTIDEVYQSEWRPRLDKEIEEMKAFEWSRLKGLTSSLPIPILCFVLASFSQPLAISKAFNKVSQAVARLGDGAQLTVLSGSPGDQYKNPMDLSSSSPLNLEILMQNMVEIRVVDRPDNPPVVTIRKRLPGEEKPDLTKPAFQSFRLTPIRSSSDEVRGVYAVAFSLKEDVDLYLSSISEDTPVASINVRTLPIPKVSLSVSGALKKPWPDDTPLPLKIGVSAENPLKQIRLLIKAEGRSSTEVVSNILANDKKNITTRYDLLLETYVQSDLSRVEIVAEAVDSAVPIPLVGNSEPLFIETASAYGRYRQTLSTLRQIKEHVDESVKANNPKIDKEANKLAQKAYEQSLDSPFFDAQDRHMISSFVRRVEDIEVNPELSRVLELQEALNDFLFEHETLDDKERDRDFFVAARALSRLIERDKNARAVESKVVIERIKTFLDERQRRWALRVRHLDSPPESWPSISKKPFSKAMDQVLSEDLKNTRSSQKKALGILSNTVTKYRRWIEELEQMETKTRRENEQKRRQGLSSAQNKLKELQRRQGQVSSRLDRAATKKHEELSENWPSTRMLQNTNLQGTKSLEAQLRALSPRSSERVKVAIQAMQAAIESGNADSFVQAESAADMAGRLLRQAQSAAQQSAQQRRRRDRRRRVTGDNYYGQQIVGGDVEIKREYSVDRKYREEILDEISESKQRARSDEEARMLEDYLRKVIR